MIVRAAELADLDAMARVHLVSSNTAYGRNDALERRLRSTRDALTQNDLRSFVAEDGGEVVGVLTVGADELYAIYVHPDHWGGGAGQALLERAHAALAETCDEAVLTCLVGNTRARRFYERNGWVPGEQLTELHFGGEPTEVVKYRKRFAAAAGRSRS